MNLYFRLILMSIKAFFEKGTVEAFSATELTFRVWPFDMDINIHMNNAKYLSIMDLGRIYHTVRCGIFKKVIKNKWMPVVGKVEIRYIRALNAFDKYTLRTEITGHDEKYFDMTQTFIRNGEEVAVAHVKGLFLNRKGRKIPPKEVI